MNLPTHPKARKVAMLVISANRLQNRSVGEALSSRFKEHLKEKQALRQLKAICLSDKGFCVDVLRNEHSLPRDLVKVARQTIENGKETR